MMTRVLSPALIFLMLGLSLAELAQWPWVPTSPGDQEMEMMERGDMTQEGLLERGLSLDTCQVQRRVLKRLRELVVESIDNIKRCLHPGRSIYR